MDLILYADESQPVGNPAGILHQKQPGGRQKQGQKEDGCRT